MSARRRLLISLAVLVAIFWIGALGYMLIGHLTARPVALFDAVYMVAISITTVGYREVIPQTVPFETWTIIVLLIGVAGMTMSISSVTAMIVEGQLGHLIGSRRVEARIQQLGNHVIVCGFGRLGQLLTQMLAERRVPVVVIEQDAARAHVIEELGQLYVIGDASEEKAIQRAGIARARCLVSVLPTDADNVFVTLTARQMRPDLQIIARAEQPTSESKLRQAGANRVISTQVIGAERIANILTRPHLVDLVDVAAQGVELEVGDFPVAATSPIVGKSLLESNIRQVANVMVVAIRRVDGSTRFNPGANEVIQANDTLITIGPSGAVARLEQLRISQTKAEQ
jgi:voltage-gated potassium channel